jgi:ubiquitin-conjugating enzyme E2 N
MSVRLKKDIENLKFEMTNKNQECVVETVEESMKDAFRTNGSMSNVKNFTIILRGPSGTPYDGGKFKLRIIIPEDYPMKAPNITFISAIKHPNVKGQSICIDILKNNWSPALMLYKVLLSLSFLLATPNPDDPLDPELATLFKINHDEYKRIAIESTKISTDAILAERAIYVTK